MRKKRSKLSKAEKLNHQIESWERKQEDAVIVLRRSAEELLKLRRQRQRNLKRETAKLRETASEEGLGPDWKPEPVNMDVIETNVAAGLAPVETKADDDIPTFLDRTNGNDKDAAARAEIEAEQAAKKKVKAERAAERRAIKQETIDAELTGKRRAMPLTGKAALAVITARDDRASRMEALGFRKTGRRK